MIRDNARYIGLFPPIREKGGLDAVARVCINIFTFLSRRSPRDGQTPRRRQDPLPQAARVSQPARGEGARRAVPVEPVLRPARPAPGQVRDAAPRARGRRAGEPCRRELRRAGEPCRRELRRLAAHLVSGAARLGGGRAAGPAAGPAGTPPAAQAHRRGGRGAAGGEERTAGTDRRRPGRVGARPLRHLGSSPQHRPRSRAGKKR